LVAVHPLKSEENVSFPKRAGTIRGNWERAVAIRRAMKISGENVKSSEKSRDIYEERELSEEIREIFKEFGRYLQYFGDIMTILEPFEENWTYWERL
jgi:hypothetical protein